ncbi:MAG: universal stress protein [Methanobacteriota archaeon]|nr:MAG: universal stress protein [Euryarchaeota archaeon]
MFERIVVALDLSEDPEKVSGLIRDLGGEGRRRIYLIHVVDVDSAGPMAGTLQADDEKALKSFAERLSKEGLEVETRVALGSPAEEILSFADEVEAGLVVVGRHRKGRLAKTFLGSVSEAVIRRSKRPVLVLKEMTP